MLQPAQYFSETFPSNEKVGKFNFRCGCNYQFSALGGFQSIFPWVREMHPLILDAFGGVLILFWHIE